MKIFHVDPDLVIAAATAKLGEDNAAKVIVTLDIKDGWFLRAIAEDDHISTFQLDVRGDDIAEILHIEYPPAYHIDLLGDPEIIYWQGSVTFEVDIKLKTTIPSHLRVVLSYQPCTTGRCMAVQHTVVDVTVRK